MAIRTRNNKIVRSGEDRKDDKGRLWCHGCQKFLDPSSFSKSVNFEFNKNTHCKKCVSASFARAKANLDTNRSSVSELHGKIRKVGEARRNEDGMLWCFKCQDYHRPSDFGANDRKPLGVCSSCRRSVGRDRAKRRINHGPTDKYKAAGTFSDKQLIALVKARVSSLNVKAELLHAQLQEVIKMKKAFADALLGE